MIYSFRPLCEDIAWKRALRQYIQANTFRDETAQCRSSYTSSQNQTVVT